jgi:protease YdgD
MLKKLIAFVTGLVVVIALGYHPSQAQTRPEIIPIPLALSSESYGSTYVPSSLEQSDWPDTRGIYGEDNRMPVVLQNVFPWSAIGKIYFIARTNEGTVANVCTGTLISEDRILTNSHCLIHPVTKQVLDSTTYRQLLEEESAKILFAPNMVEGRFTQADLGTVIPEFTYGWDNGSQDSSQDWAILKVVTRDGHALGDKYGYLGWRQLDFSDPTVLSALENQIRLAGYSGEYPNEEQRQELDLEGRDGETAGVHMGCSIEGLSDNLPYRSNNVPVESGMLLHTCDTMGGASGSAMLAKFSDGNYYIVGLHRGVYGVDPESLPEGERETCRVNNPTGGVDEWEACRNAAVQVSLWADQAAEMRNES